MPNTYSQAYFHIVFAVKHRVSLIQKPWKDELEKYITGIVQNHKHKMLAINTMPDHMHLFIGYNLNQKIPDLVFEIKTSSNRWIRESRLCKHKFDWQQGYGAFTHSRSQIDGVVKYVLNQEKHHQNTTFKDEYLEILRRNDIAFSEEYVFEFFQDVNGWDT